MKKSLDETDNHIWNFHNQCTDGAVVQRKTNSFSKQDEKTDLAIVGDQHKTEGQHSADDKEQRVFQKN